MQNVRPSLSGQINAYFKTMLLVRFSAVLLLLLFIFGKNLSAQSLRGGVREAELNAGVFRPTVFLMEKKDTLAFTRADADGFFEIKSPKSGIFSLQIRAVGYETRIIPEIELSKGKEAVIEIFLKTASQTLQAVEIRAENPDRQLQIGQTILTREAVLRYPATFFDPARLAQNLPGVSNDDQNNGISVNGLSPALFQYRIEGLEIVNPNHLSNAGTPSDLPTPSSGGVSMLSAQMLGNSSIYTSSTPVGLGNSVGGLMDIRLRPGNSDHFEATIQAGLVGLDASVEGPISRKKTGSFLVNYRYSTIGILEKMGVQLGDESVNFQDLSAHIQQNIGEKHRLSAFFIGGNSSNYFAGKADSADWKTQKDQYEIDFGQRTNIVGLNYKRYSKKSRVWTIGLASSFEETRHFQSTIYTDEKKQQTKSNQINTARLVYNTRFGRKSRFELGGQITRLHFSNQINTSSTDYDRGLPFHIFNNLEFTVTDNFGCQVGWRYAAFDGDISGTIIPFLSSQIKFDQSKFLKIKIEKAHQTFLLFNRRLSAKQLVGGRLSVQYHQKIKESSQFMLELFASKFSKSISNNINTSKSVEYSLMDRFGEILPENAFTHNFQEIGYQTGLSATFNHPFQNGKFFQINGSVFDAKQKDTGNKLISTRFNSRWTTNLTVGKEWQQLKSNGEKLRTLGISGSVRARGGFRESPIDLELSNKFHQTIFVGSQYNSLQLPTYFRADLRLFWKKNYKNRTGTLALDVQNVTNRQNVAWHYYDTFLKKVVAKTGLGLIPILSYRLDFNFKKVEVME
jgi:hypothetical protein